jgi:hypothetical protein
MYYVYYVILPILGLCWKGSVRRMALGSLPVRTVATAAPGRSSQATAARPAAAGGSIRAPRARAAFRRYRGGLA